MKQYEHMDTQTEKIAEKTEQVEIKVQQSNSNWLKTLSIGLGVIGIGLAIGIGGYFLGVNKTQTPPAISQLSPIPDPDPTADWKTYANNDWGFQIKYPSNYDTSGVRGTSLGKSLQTNYGYIDFRSLGNPPLENTKQININGFQGYERPLGGNMDGGIEFEILFQNANKNSYLDILFTTTQKGYESKIEEFRKILSTFKFTNQEKAIAPLITLLSPNGGEILKSGETYTLKWDSSGVDKIYFNLVNGGKEFATTGPISASVGQYNWIVPDMSGWAKNNFKIFIHNNSATNDIRDSSDATFTIK